MSTLKRQHGQWFSEKQIAKKVKKSEDITASDLIISYYLPDSKYADVYEKSFIYLRKNMCFKTEFYPRGGNDIEFFIIFEKFYENNCTFLNYMKHYMKKYEIIKTYIGNLENMNVNVVSNLY
jgi:hypothetical protein